MPGENLAGRAPVLSDDELFGSIQQVETNLGHEPGAMEYVAEGKYSITPFKKRFGSRWQDTLAHYRRWKAEHPEAKDIDAPVGDGDPPAVRSMASEPEIDGTVRRGTFPPTLLYGEPFDFRGLRHGPINEQGVVYLFGMVSRELGFYVESIQQGFPDCEAKYLYDAKKKLWARARIEFEFKASSFREHGHDAGQCDFIVCWINDWPDCAIPIIELRAKILTLPRT